MSLNTKKPQYSIRANKGDWKRFQKLSEKADIKYSALFRDMLNAYERELRALKRGGVV